MSWNYIIIFDPFLSPDLFYDFKPIKNSNLSYIRKIIKKAQIKEWHKSQSINNMKFLHKKCLTIVNTVNKN